jgi:general secretion pathway protein N
MMRRVAITLVALTLSIVGAARSATAPADSLDAGINDGVRLDGPSASPSEAEPVTTVRVAAPPPAPVRALSANPLWAIPLTQLSGTRDRPIFSPSRRPAPVAAATEPAVVRPPPRKKAIEPPPLSLVGTIASDEESFGIFIDQSTKAALRLKVGEDHQGWKLKTIHGREVTMEKDQQGAVLTLPQPGGGASGEVRLVPVSAVMPR